VVSASQLLLVQTDAITGPGGSLFTGQILQQSGTFTAASLDAVGVLETQGLDTNNSPATPDAQAGFFTPNGSGSLSVTLDDNDGGTMSTGTASGTYSVASNGRRDHYPDWRKTTAALVYDCQEPGHSAEYRWQGELWDR